ncbi:hypothetical protein F4802DRAFT_353853 [Xylaria palmicola]|nr:hypothetical protein F4802DRAFT_353853 [Xylaria palmicola]
MKNVLLLALFPISGLAKDLTQAGDLTAASVTAASVTAGSVTAGSVTAGSVTAGLVTQASVTQGSVTQASAGPKTQKAGACVPYKSPLTLEPLCCDELTHSLFWTNKLLGVGICCLLGEILDGLTCAAPPPPPADAGVCSGASVCPRRAGADLGIRYGHCYVLRALGGLYLGHDYAAKYEVQGENPGVVFRVCADTAACATAVDALVGANDTWWMQDQMGDPAGTGFGWLGGSGDLSVQDGAAGALVVGGSSVCYGGKCAVCIRFPPGGAHAPCPLSPGQSHLGLSSNPNNCQSFFWEEVGCRSEK